MESYIIYMAFIPKSKVLPGLREGPLAPGRTLLGSEEEAVRLRGEKYGCKAIDY